MKKVTAILAFASFFVLASSCKKETKEGEVNNVSTAYKAFAIDYTATWCNPCGANGLPAFIKLFDDYKYQVVGVSMHAVDAITTQVPAAATEVKNAYSITGTPSFVVNVKKSPNSYNSVNNDVKATLATKPVCGIGVSKTISGTTMTINYVVKFFKDYADGCKLAMYVVENGVPSSQTGSPATTQHDHVFRGTPTGSGAWGIDIAAGAIAAGAIYEGTATFELTSDVVSPDKLEVVAVTYSNKMAENKPAEYLNGNTSEKAH